MSQFAVLVGHDGEDVTLLASGDPREVRKEFKTFDKGGFDKIEVLESGSGRTRKRQFLKKPVAKKAAKKAARKATS